MKIWRIIMLILTIIIWLVCITFLITNYNFGWVMAVFGWFIALAYRVQDVLAQ